MVFSFVIQRGHTAVCRNVYTLVVVLLAVTLLGGCVSSTLLVPDFSRLAKIYGPAVVHISVKGESVPLQAAGGALPNNNEASLGAGFIVSDDGYILTNAHVVSRATQINIKLIDRREFKARLIGIDQLADVALLKIDASHLPTVNIGNPDHVDVGEWAFAIGSPYGFQHSASVGIISAKRRILSGVNYIPFIQTDVPVNPGNSGGPLFNLRGEVIGINSQIYSNNGGYQGLSFAIPIDVAMRIKAQLQLKGSVTRSRLGITVQEVSQGLADSFYLGRPRGALVGYVEPKAAANRAGMKPGDVILQVNGRDVVQSADALIYIADAQPGDNVRILVWRERASLVIDVVPDRFDAPVMSVGGPVESMPLGLTVRPLQPQEQHTLRIDGGLLVQRVNAATLRAGVNVGDVIIAVNGQSVASLSALAEQVRMGEGAVALLIQRGATRLFVPIDTPKPAAAEAPV